MSRRSRFKPSPSDRIERPTKKDIENFVHPINTYMYLPKEHVVARGVSRAWAAEKLENMFHDLTPLNDQLVTKRFHPKIPRRIYHPFPDWYHVKRTAHFYLEQHGFPTETMTQYGRKTNKDLDHSFMEAHFLFSFLELGAKKDDVRVVPWWEILDYWKCPEATRALGPDAFTIPLGQLNGQPTTITPDNFFGLHFPPYEKSDYRFFALEIDMATEQMKDNPKAHSPLNRKFKNYLQIFDQRIYEKRFGLPNLTVLIATERGPRSVGTMLKNLKELRASPPPILFKSFKPHAWLAQKPEPELWDEPWQSVSGETGIRPVHPVTPHQYSPQSSSPQRTIISHNPHGEHNEREIERIKAGKSTATHFGEPLPLRRPMGFQEPHN